MFDNHDSGSRTGSLGSDDSLAVYRRQVCEHLQEHGPLPVASLQADLFPSRPEVFERVLEVLVCGGTLDVSRGRVEVNRNVTTLSDPVSVDLSNVVVTLRPAEGRDYRDLAGLASAVAADSEHEGLQAFAQALRETGRIHRWDGPRERVVFVADIDDRLGGWVHLSPVTGESRQGTVNLIGGVAPPYRDEGVGSQLLYFGLERARTNDYRRVSQHIPAHDVDAFQFLRTHGWWVDGTRHRSDTPEEETVEELRVVQDLDCQTA